MAQFWSLLSEDKTLSYINSQFSFGEWNFVFSIPAIKDHEVAREGSYLSQSMSYLEYLDIENLCCSGCPLVIP